MNKKKIIIIGGGIAGLTVAHELSRYEKYQIYIYEKDTICGGKARSYRHPDGSYKGEHALRAFYTTYNSLFKTIREIPYKDQSVFENLIPSRQVFEFKGEKLDLFSLDGKDKLKNIRKIILFLRSQNISYSKLLFLLKKIIIIAFISKKELNKLKSISISDYLNLNSNNKAYNKTILGLIEIFMACKGDASAYEPTRLLFYFFLGGILKKEHSLTSFKSNLNGPTSEKFIDPWVEMLRSKGVQIHTSCQINKIDVSNNKITSLSTTNNLEIKGDEFIFTLPAQQFLSLLDKNEKLKKTYRYNHIKKISNTELSMGLQFHLKYIPENLKKYRQHTIGIFDSPWKIVYIIQNVTTWKEHDFGKCEGILSLAVSNDYSKGKIIKKRVSDCSENEIFQEVLYQIGIPDDAIKERYLSEDSLFLTPEEFKKNANRLEGWKITKQKDKLFVNQSYLIMPKPGCYPEVEHRTGIDNLFLASEFTRSNFIGPTMERSNETAKLCAEQIILQDGLSYDKKRRQIVAVPTIKEVIKK